MDITTVIINFQTPDLLKVAVSSFKEVYPDIKLLIIDNGSKDEGRSKTMINQLEAELTNTEAIYFEKNIYHGPAMNKVIEKFVDSRFTFFLDSDTETKKPGFLEKMIEILSESEEVYGVGEIVRSNKRGYKAEDGEKVLLTPYMMINTTMYRSLRPFIHHGQPTLQNFADARSKGFELKEFPISDYIDHLWRGTASKFGYGFGIKGKIDYLLNKMGI